jgi:hypothetical protein
MPFIDPTNRRRRVAQAEAPAVPAADDRPLNREGAAEFRFRLVQLFSARGGQHQHAFIAEIADKSGLPVRVIDAFMTLRESPSPESVDRLASALGVQAAWLRGDVPREPILRS